MVAKEMTLMSVSHVEATEHLSSFRVAGSRANLE